MSSNLRLGIRPRSILYGLAAGGVVCGAYVLVRDPFLRGEISANRALLSFSFLLISVGGPLFLLGHFGKTVMAGRGANATILVESLVGLATLFWLLLALQAASRFGVGLPGPCADLLSLHSPLPWVLAAAIFLASMSRRLIGARRGDFHRVGERKPEPLS